MKTPKEIQISLGYELDKINETLENSSLLASQIRELHAFFYSLDSLRFCYFYPSDANVIVGIRTREDLAKIRAMHKGIWAKGDATGCGDGDIVKYTARVNGIGINVHVTELPPSCRVVEEKREIPAYTETIRRLVCSEPSEATAQKGEVLSIEREEPIPF